MSGPEKNRFVWALWSACVLLGLLGWWAMPAYAQGNQDVIFEGHVLNCSPSEEGIARITIWLQLRTSDAAGTWTIVDDTVTGKNGFYRLNYRPPGSIFETENYRVVERSPLSNCEPDTDTREFFGIRPGDTVQVDPFRDRSAATTATATVPPGITPAVTSTPTISPTEIPTLTVTPTPTPSPTYTPTVIWRMQLPLIRKQYPPLWQQAALADVAIKALAVDPGNPQIMYAGTSEGIYRRLYCEGTWYETSLSSVGVYAVAAARVPSGYVFVGTWGHGVYRSTDAGVTWTAVNQGLGSLYINALALSPNYAADQTIYAGTNTQGIYKSNDGGDTWQPINNGLSSLDILSLAVHPLSPRLLLAGTFGQGVFRSQDGGNSWQSISIGNDIVWSLVISPGQPNLIYAGTDGGVFRSEDTGANWISTDLEIKTYTLVIHPRNPSYVWAGTSGSGVRLTRSGGAHWKSANHGLDNRVVQALALDVQACDAIYAGTNDGIWQHSPE